MNESDLGHTLPWQQMKKTIPKNLLVRPKKQRRVRIREEEKKLK